MRKVVYSLLGLVVILAALAVAYSVGSIRGAHFARFDRQSHKMYSHHLVAKVLGEKDYEAAYRYNRGLAEAIYRDLSRSPMLHERWFIPVIDWGEDRPKFFFEIDDATRRQFDTVASYLADSEAKSNNSIQGTGANAPVPDL